MQYDQLTTCFYKEAGFKPEAPPLSSKAPGKLVGRSRGDSNTPKNYQDKRRYVK